MTPKLPRFICNHLKLTVNVFVQKTLQNLQDASDDLMLFDDNSLFIPYQIGDVFINHSQDETQEMLESAKVSVTQTVSQYLF